MFDGARMLSYIYQKALLILEWIGIIVRRLDRVDRNTLAILKAVQENKDELLYIKNTQVRILGFLAQIKEAVDPGQATSLGLEAGDVSEQNSQEKIPG